MRAGRDLIQVCTSKNTRVNAGMRFGFRLDSKINRMVLSLDNYALKIGAKVKRKEGQKNTPEKDYFLSNYHTP